MVIRSVVQTVDGDLTFQNGHLRAVYSSSLMTYHVSSLSAQSFATTPKLAFWSFTKISNPIQGRLSSTLRST